MKRKIKWAILATTLVVLGLAVYFDFYELTRTSQSIPHSFVNEYVAVPLKTYRKDTGNYPTTAQGLRALIATPPGVKNWHGPYIMGNEVPKDPWGNEYQYASPGVHNPKSYDVWSFGPNGPKAKDDDWIGNW